MLEVKQLKPPRIDRPTNSDVVDRTFADDVQLLGQPWQVFRVKSGDISAFSFSVNQAQFFPKFKVFAVADPLLSKESTTVEVVTRDLLLLVIVSAFCDRLDRSS